MPHIKAGELNLEYYVEGSGPALLMITGYGGQAISWGRPFIEFLTPHFTTIRLSNRGTGTSDVPAAPFMVRDMADDAANLLTALGIEKSHVLGVSMGGMIAQEYVLAYPDRVQGLVLGCTTPGGPNAVSAAADVFTAIMPQPGLSREDQIRKAWPVICAPRFIQSAGVFLEAMLTQNLVHPTPMDTILKQTGAISQFNTFDRLSQIKAPTLVIHGDSDRLVPTPNGRILAERIPGAELFIIRDTGHMFFWETPREGTTAVIDFLSKVPAAV